MKNLFNLKMIGVWSFNVLIYSYKIEMSAAARVRLEDAGRVPELNHGCDLTVEPGANSAGHPSRSDARGNVVEERARRARTRRASPARQLGTLCGP